MVLYLVDLLLMDNVNSLLFFSIFYLFFFYFFMNNFVNPSFLLDIMIEVIHLIEIEILIMKNVIIKDILVH